ncbi:MAG: VPLPA-CTERM sorting domain-containing protein [Rhodobacteraceae bacterium]|nr:VPLPA-CTERM sorting domain-containing protein [Paracoccaceae bacterium]
MFAAWGIGAQASTVFSAPTISFTDLDSSFNGAPVYEENGFAFDPTSFQAGNCSPYATSNDPCIKEVQQTGTVTTMTSLNPGELFTLTSFYFDLQGTGGQNPINQLILSSDKTTAATQLVFQVGQLAPSDAQLYDNYSYSGGVLSGDAYNGTIGNNDSYFAVLSSPLFQDVEYVTWSTYQAQNLRIDDISVAGLAPVPVPAAGWLLVSALGGIGLMRRRRKS